MKWSSVNESDENTVSLAGMLNGGAQAPLQNVSDMARPASSPRSQDDAMVTYFFQRPQTDADFDNFPKQHSRWALGDESLVDLKQGPSLDGEIVQQPADSAVSSQLHQILPSAKKLWGMDDQNFNVTGQTWRDSAWSTATMEVDHAVSQPIGVGPRRSGSFPGNDVVHVLSPRSSETGGLGVKMVEYVLGSSPTNKDLESQLRRLVINAPQEKDDEKSPSPSPLKDIEGTVGTVQNHGIILGNGISNEEKPFSFKSRPAGSPRPSPAEEDSTKTPNSSISMSMVMKPDDLVLPPGSSSVVGPFSSTGLGSVPTVGLANGMVPNGVCPPHTCGLGLTGASAGAGAEGHASHFQQVMMEPPGMAFDNSYSVLSAMDQQMGMMQPNMEASQLCRAHIQQQQILQQQQQQGQQQQQQSQQIQQLLAQQQFIASQQQQLGISGPPGAAPSFPGPPYVLNPQEPYMGALIAGPAPMMPQYFGMTPWGMFPAGMLPPGPAPAPLAAAPGTPQQQQQQRRPLSPGSLQEHPPVPQGQYQVIPAAFYDQNGSLVMRGLSNGPPVRLVSPASVILNPGHRQPGAPAAPQATAPGSLYSAAALGNQNGMGLGGTPQMGSTIPGSSFGSLGLQQQQPGSLGSIGSPSLGLSLANPATGRRDSLDRTGGSTFSPSLDYGRVNKWPQSYGALGTVTAASGPLGLTQSGGSMTPPPMGLASSGLQLGIGPFVNGGRIVSAAPGSEVMRYRNGTTCSPGAVFGSGGGSLFSKIASSSAAPRHNGIGGGTPGQADKVSGRSRLLEDFRNNRYPNLQLRDIANHIVEFSQDQHGSRFIQQKLERASPAEKQLVFQEILNSAYALITDVFGNYVIQKFFEFGTQDQKAALAQKIRGHVLQLALQMYGCRVIQKALESVPTEQQKELVRELDGHVLKCVKDQNGNHVVQKCIECVEPQELQFLIDAFEGQVLSLSTHPYGCRVIQRILEHCTTDQIKPILNELHQHTEALIQDQYGNYVIQHVLEHGNPEDKSRIVSSVRGKVLQLSQHKFASNVVEKCISHATRAERSMLIDEIVANAENNSNSPLHAMMKDQFANYVVQKMIDVAEPAQRKVLMHKIRPHINTLRKYTYGKHILAKLEKYFNKNSTDLGPIGAPPQQTNSSSTI